MIWNDVEILTEPFRWVDALSSATTDDFLEKKALAEAKLNAYYAADATLAAKGYMRTLVLRYGVFSFV